MEIHCADPARALLAVETIFGEDVADGPVREVPEALRHALDMPQFDGWAKVELRPPVAPDTTPPGFVITLHRMVILCHGHALGYALRMDRSNLALLAHWERKSGLAPRPS